MTLRRCHQAIGLKHPAKKLLLQQQQMLDSTARNLMLRMENQDGESQTANDPLRTALNSVAGQSDRIC